MHRITVFEAEDRPSGEALDACLWALADDGRACILSPTYTEGRYRLVLPLESEVPPKDYPRVRAVMWKVYFKDWREMNGVGSCLRFREDVCNVRLGSAP